MAKYKMAATDMATGRIIAEECHKFLFHIAEFHVRPEFPHKIYASELQRFKLLEENNEQGSDGGLRLPRSSSLCHDHLLKD